MMITTNATDPASANAGTPELPLRSLIGILLLFSLLLSLTGCDGLTPQAKARHVATQFLSALDNRDSDAARALLTDAARQRLGDVGNPSGHILTGGGVMAVGGGSTPDANPYTVTGDAFLDSDGQTARVPFTKKDANGEPHTGAILLRNTADGWRVYAIEIAIGDGLPDLTIDFEHPEKMMEQLGRIVGQGIGAAMRNASQGVSSMMNGFSQGYAAGYQAGNPQAAPLGKGAP